MTRLDQVLSRALDYPYARPSHSYVFPNTKAITVKEEHEYLSDHSLAAVLAIGSNAAPSQLMRKFGTNSGTIPVLAVDIRGIDVVHANFVCSYGAVPATVTPREESEIEAHMTMLNAEQFRRMNETESGYSLVRYFGQVNLKSGKRVEKEILMYVANYKLLAGGVGVERMWGGIGARVGEFEALRIAMEQVGQKGGVEEFVEKVVGDAEFRESVNKKLGGKVPVVDVKGVWQVVRNLGQD